MKVRALFALAAALSFGASCWSFVSSSALDSFPFASFFAVPNSNAPRPADNPPPRELRPESKLLLIRNVSGEFAKAVQPIPGGKKGFTLHVGKGISEQA